MRVVAVLLAIFCVAIGANILSGFFEATKVHAFADSEPGKAFIFAMVFLFAGALLLRSCLGKETLETARK
jgi:hypothetical protein